MNTKRLRNFAFTIHRYLGLILGLLLIFIGITGSLLVFEREIENIAIARQFGTVIPQEQTISIDRVTEIAQNTYPDWDLVYIRWSDSPQQPLIIRMEEREINPNIYMDGEHQVFIDPYTGEVLGDRIERYTYYRFLLNLHYRLFIPGDTGMYITGIAALLLLIISATGIWLWSGWRKLISGFKIKWKAHPKRVNYDIHKVAGIIVAIFFLLIAFTGFCWNFDGITYPVINALTLSPVSKEIAIEQPQSGQNIARPSVILSQAQKAVPEMNIEFFVYPYEATDPFFIYGKFDETVYVNPYTTEVLKVELPEQMSLGDRLTSSFLALHNGAFAGLPTRILYVLVGLSPIILFITGLVMYRLRRRPRTVINVERELIER